MARSTPDKCQPPLDFSKILVGSKTLTDAIMDISGNLKRNNPSLADSDVVLRAISTGDIEKMREISNYFFKVSGIYARLIKYMGYLYKYDWYITPYVERCQGLIRDPSLNIYSSKEIKSRRKYFNEFFEVLNCFQKFKIKQFLGSVAVKVLRFGCYYGYVIPQSDTFSVQELPYNYCRSRFKINNNYAIEFQMKYFDDTYTDEAQRSKILDFFPQDFKKGYKLYKNGKLPPAFQGDQQGWYLLDPKYSIKFNLNEEDYPTFIAVIPAIIDLDNAKDLDKARLKQKLLKLIIQKMPIDKNGDLVFDVDEAQAMHNNAVTMLQKAIGIHVLTTFADAEVADMADRNNTTSTDDLERVERAVFNESGTSELLFNSTGQSGIANSILNDEANMSNLIQQFEGFLNFIMDLKYNKNPKKITYMAQILPTTIFNYKDLAKLYKEQAQLGYSKMLPQVALGQTQSSILANSYFENNILDLTTAFIPPLSSNVMNAEALEQLRTGKIATSKEGAGSNEGGEGAGRPELPDDEKSEKTLANRESM